MPVTTKPTKKAMWELIDQLRAIAPKRPLTYGESLQLARVQAARVRDWANAATTADINLIWLVDQQAVPVHFVPSHRLNQESGLTTDYIDNQLQVFINENEPPLRQRFSLLHEFKHVLDFKDASVLHQQLGCGNEDTQKNLIEAVANDFAAHVLMPTALVKRLWLKTTNHDVQLMANTFCVSVEAMSYRLKKLNLTSDPKPRPRGYFRRCGLPTLSQPAGLSYLAG
ncbi:ImmA/IrrE family metallo-endopeptidase [Fodinicola acaciae]|uniref:ImmA/IrrE family metallo-endopeptidase n=1 Tax=Fodinicola acaciae TaxID=2681555 RepID=UPI0013D8176C|nr:ImmA/IrrE family metallo-endopeptidase [Fodinicola acaciae]